LAKPCFKIVAVLSYTMLLTIVASGISLCKDALVEPTHMGDVIGRIYDAATSLPVEGATISIMQDAVFETGGPSVGSTDASGMYRCRTLIGRQSSSFNVGRALNSSLIGLLAGSAKDVKKRIDVNSLTVTITKNGYKAYQGTLPCRDLDADRFAVIMEPVLLAPDTSEQVSTVSPGRDAIEITDVIITPSIIRPNSDTAVIVMVKCPGEAESGGIKVKARSVPLGDEFLELKEFSNGIATFSKKMHASGKVSVGATKMSIELTDCPEDFAGDIRQASAMVQVVKTPEEEKAAILREEALTLIKDGKNPEAIEALKKLCALLQATAADWSALGTAYQDVQDYAAAAKIWQNVILLSPKGGTAAAREGYINALYLSRDYDQMLREVPYAMSNNLLDSLKQDQNKDNKTSPELLAKLGMAYLKKGMVEQAGIVAQFLKNSNIVTESGTKFFTELWFAHLELMVAKDTANADNWAEYGRALMNSGRWEEAVDKLQKAIKLDPNARAVQADLEYACLHLKKPDTGKNHNLDQALASAEKSTMFGEEKSKDFHTWHTYGTLLYAKYHQLKIAGDESTGEVLDKCITAVSEALKCGREGKEQYSESRNFGIYGYYGSNIMGIEGYAYPEAKEDFIILSSLKCLKKNPGHAFAHFNLAAALANLSMYDMAADALNECLQINPKIADVKYLQAIIAGKQGDMDKSIILLKEVVKENPMHPNANQQLAKLLMEDGDSAAAAACLATHAKYYGRTRKKL
jgi:tetratricopeptide (TPR) repeat protein